MLVLGYGDDEAHARVSIQHGDGMQPACRAYCYRATRVLCSPLLCDMLITSRLLDNLVQDTGWVGEHTHL